MRPRVRAAQIHERFSTRPGSEHIATRSAIEGLILWLQRTRPRRVLEIGSGIGTLTQATVSTLLDLHGPGGFSLVTLEDHPFCRTALRENLASDWAHLTLQASVDELAVDRPPDFLITDGGDPTDDRPFRSLAPRATVFIEGDRRPQATRLEEAIGGRRFAEADVRLLRRRPDEEGQSRRWDGGYRVYRLDPTPWDRMLCRGIGLRTKVVYRLRRWLA